MDAKELLKIIEAHRLWLMGDKAGNRANLTRANLSDADLSDANLTRADLTGANLSDANLSDADLSGANLTGANLTDANLSGADLTGANLTGANLTRAHLTGADLTRANLTDANLTFADLTFANLTHADLTIFPDLFILKLQPANSKLRAWKFVRKNGESPIQPDNKITYVVGETFSVKDGATDDRIYCGPGLNVATLPWCLANLKTFDRGDDILIEVEFYAKDILAVPFATDGKFRVSKLKVIRSISKKEGEAMMREYLKPYGKEED